MTWEAFAENETLDELMQALTEALREWWEDPPALSRLTGYPWWLAGLANIETSP